MEEESQEWKDTNAVSVYKKRQRIACDHCRQRKSKCDGQLPCSYCKEKSISCRYAEPTRRGPISKKECNNGISFSVFTEYKMIQTLETKRYITLYMDHVNPLFPMCNEAHLLNPQSSAQKVQTYAALAFVAQVCGNAQQSKVFIANAKQLAASFFDEPSFDAAVAMVLIGQYWFNLTQDHTKASQYSSMAYSLAKHLPLSAGNILVRNFAYFYHIFLDPALAPSQTSGTLNGHIPTLKSANWAASEIFSEFMLMVSKVVRVIRTNVSISQTFFNLSNAKITNEADRAELINCVNQLDYKLYRSPRLPESTRTFYTVSLRMSRTWMEWKSGHLVAAAEAGVQVLHLFQSLKAEGKLYIMFVDRPNITVEFCGLVVCALREAGRPEEAEQLIQFFLEYFPAHMASSRMVEQINEYQIRRGTPDYDKLQSYLMNQNNPEYETSTLSFEPGLTTLPNPIPNTVLPHPSIP